MTNPRPSVRAGLMGLALLHFTLAGWILLAPRSFFGLVWVNMNMAYNEHLLLDFGAMNLPLALVLGMAARTMDARMVRTALQGTLLFSALHLVIHIRYLGAMTVGNTALLMTGLASTVALPLTLLVLHRRTSSATVEPESGP